MDLNSLIVYDVNLKKVRLGRDFDGGYVICQIGQTPESNPYDCFISGGIGGDISFEEGFLKMFSRMKCHAFDGTINPLFGKRIIFTKKNISSRENLYETNLHDLINRHKDLFIKFDIEGGEYDWLDSVSDNQLKKIKQLVIELHGFSQQPQQSNALSRLAKIYWLAHLHGNNFGGVRKINNVIIPNTIECTYIRKSEINQVKLNKYIIPTKFDRSNAPELPDIELKGYPYHQNIKLL